MGKVASTLGGLALTMIELAGLGVLAWGITSQSRGEEQVEAGAAPTRVESRQALRQDPDEEARVRQELAEACAELARATANTGEGGSEQGQATVPMR